MMTAILVLGIAHLFWAVAGSVTLWFVMRHRPPVRLRFTRRRATPVSPEERPELFANPDPRLRDPLLRRARELRAHGVHIGQFLATTSMQARAAWEFEDENEDSTT